MLKHAYNYKDKLQEKYATAVCDEYFKYYTADSYTSYTLDIEMHDWNTIQRVSVGKHDEILGYMACSINRDSGVVCNFGIANFTKAINPTFSRDMIEFLVYLRDNCTASKFEFLAIKGSPAEKLYNKFIKRFGGRIVGVKTRTTKLVDGKMYDAVLYEILREEMTF